jgi:hypothetical protein
MDLCEDGFIYTQKRKRKRKVDNSRGGREEGGGRWSEFLIAF